MNKREYGEFHRYLAYLIYEYNEVFNEPDLTEESRNETGEILQALETVMKICIIDKDNCNNIFYIDKENK